MPSRTLAGPLALVGGRSAHESGWSAEMNENLLRASVFAQLTVKSRTTGTPPGSPANGDIYIVPASGTTGVWVGKENQVAVRDNGAWVYYVVGEGFVAYVQSDDFLYNFNGTTWVPISQPADVNAFVAGTPGVSAKVLRYVFNRTVVFQDDFAGSRATADTAATASTVFSIKKNGTSIGTITFASSGTTGTFATTGSTVETFAAGDVLSIVAPGSADATLADISFNLAGIR